MSKASGFVHPENLSISSCEEDDSEEDVVEETGDAILGSLRSGMKTVKKHARKEIGNCTDEDSMKLVKSELETITFQLLKGEKKFLETAKIVAGIVDDIVTDPSESESEETDESKIWIPTVEKISNRHNIDKLRPKLPTNDELLTAQSKMSEIFTCRMEDYSESLTMASFQDHPKFNAIQKEIHLGIQDFKFNEMKMNGAKNIDSKEGEADFLPEDPYEDDSILPTKDPVTKKPMRNPIMNKFCHHVFEEESLLDYIQNNPGAKCPTYLCQNNRPLSIDQFNYDQILKEKILAKNTKNRAYTC